MSRDLNMGNYDASGNLKVTNVEGLQSTYGYAAVAITPAATPTDLLTISGSATKTVRVKSVTVSGQATTAGSMDVSIVKRTAVNTAGTASAPVPGKFDSSDAAATAALAQYSANATALGAGVVIATKKLNLGLAGAGGSVTFDFATRNDKALILRGATQALAINLNGQAVPAGGTITYAVEFEEDNS
ncbi:hypothetical protein E4K67_22480 [Desulfosporosinus fructosivorans]|uniref:Uncharacterized protein n=1 Tax=Desulfosporosinus fructosivorans TaxID=2018669 RepID=A0A4Z0R2L5_9FIRM|nr:hypothetical protein [Desulfosporosinus fructosivorans]TGE35886.1 hypothetical protein E4K67_22480 [Desulfosporosinus fructosivorans]